MTPTEHRHGTDRAAARDALLPADPGARLDLSLMSRQRGGLLSSEGRALGKSVLVAPPVCMGRRGAFCDPGGVWRTASATADSAAERWGSIPCQGSIHLPPADASSVGPGGLVAIGERAPSTPLCMGVEPGDGMRSGTFAFGLTLPAPTAGVSSTGRTPGRQPSTAAESLEKLVQFQQRRPFSFAIAGPVRRGAVAHWTSVNANAAFKGNRQPIRVAETRRRRGADSGVTVGEATCEPSRAAETARLNFRRVAQSAEPLGRTFESCPDVQSSYGFPARGDEDRRGRIRSPSCPRPSGRTIRGCRPPIGDG